MFAHESTFDAPLLEEIDTHLEQQAKCEKPRDYGFGMTIIPETRRSLALGSSPYDAICICRGPVGFVIPFPA